MVLKSVKKIRCALMCVVCDIPAGQKICGFLGHNGFDRQLYLNYLIKGLFEDQ